MEWLVSIIPLLKEWGFSAALVLVLLYMHNTSLKEMVRAMDANRGELGKLIAEVGKILQGCKDQQLELRGLRSDVQELFKVIVWGKGIYQHLPPNLEVRDISRPLEMVPTNSSNVG